MRSVLGFAGRVLVWLVLLGAGAAIVVAVLVPRIAGATPYTILTGSMRPAMPPGTLVVDRPVDPETLRTGDVVTVQLTSGRPVYVTHRIVAVERRLDGGLRFQTQGDANDVADDELRRPEQIRGKRWYSVPYLGYVSNAISGQHRQVAVYVVAAGLLAYAVRMFATARRRTPQPAGRRRKEE